MNVTKLENGYTLVSVPGKALEISTLKAGDVVRQSLGTELFVIWQVRKIVKELYHVEFKRLNDNDLNGEPSIKMYFPADEMVWHVGEVY